MLSRNFNLLCGNFGYGVTRTVLHACEDLFAVCCPNTVKPVTCCAESIDVNIALVQKQVGWPVRKENTQKARDEESAEWWPVTVWHQYQQDLPALVWYSCFSVELICCEGFICSVSQLGGRVQLSCLSAPAPLPTNDCFLNHQNADNEQQVYNVTFQFNCFDVSKDYLSLV